VTVLTVVAVGVIGGAAAIGRFLLDGAVAARVGRGFPFGTLTVNLLGALLLGVLAGAALSAEAMRLAAVGLLGSFTTFSTWALESHRLGEDGRLRLGVANFLLSLVLGVTAVWLGRWIGGLL
jgi:fluoride exporter